MQSPPTRLPLSRTRTTGPVRFSAPTSIASAHEVARGVENPDRYVVRIEWDSVEGHEQGFRRGPAFGEFFALVKPFFEAIEEMTHYSPATTA